MRNLKIIFLMLLSSIVVLFSCDNKKPTEQPDMGTLVGEVLQQSRRLTYFIPNAKINVDGYVTYSDSIGRFEIEVPKGSHSISCSVEEFDTTYISKILVTDSRAYNLRMTGPTYTVSGTVTDSIGTVVEDAIVQLEHLVETSDANGYFAFDSIPNGEWSIIVTQGDFYGTSDSVNVSGANLACDISLIQRYFTVSGVVSDTLGNPVESVLVELSDLDAYTNALGEYVLHPVENGEYAITALSQNYHSSLDTIVINGVDVQKDLVVTLKSYTISGTVSNISAELLNGVEVVLDGTFIDSTDISGVFEFEYVSSGSHQLEFFSDVYDYEKMDFILGAGDYSIIISLDNLYKDTVWVEEDALIRIHKSTDNVYSYGDENFGTDTVNALNHSLIEYLQWDSLGQYRVTGYSTTRILLKTGTINVVSADSVLLVLPFYKPYGRYYGDIRISGISEYWNEMAVTWYNQPTINAEYITLDVSNYSKMIRLNITNQISLFNNTNGFRISFVNEHCYFCDLGINFYSSEHPDISKRPHILIYRSQ